MDTDTVRARLKRFNLGQALVHQPDGQQPAERASQETDYGRRGKGYVLGAFQPATGAALTATYGRRTTAHLVGFLEQVYAWLWGGSGRVYVILDNLSDHRATDVLPLALGHPSWGFVFQPKYVAYLNLIEPWWQVLRSLALKGRRFETWAELCDAIARARACRCGGVVALPPLALARFCLPRATAP